MIRQCKTWPDAFSLCRELDKPITVVVPNVHAGLDEACRIFPSGRCEHLRFVLRSAISNQQF